MLRFPSAFVGDERANIIAKKHINKRLQSLIKNVLVKYASEMNIQKIEDSDRVFSDLISGYFPKDYPREQMCGIFFGLYGLLESDDDYVPKLIMEYVLASLITDCLKRNEETGISTIQKIEQERNYVFDKIVEDMQELYNDEETIEEAKESILFIEDMSEYLEFCFWDCDYSLLDSYTEDELRESSINETLGLGLEERHVFFLPRGWY